MSAELEDRRVNYERRADQRRLQVCYVVVEEETFEADRVEAIFLAVDEALEYADGRNARRRPGPDYVSQFHHEWVVYERDFGPNPREDRKVS